MLVSHAIWPATEEPEWCGASDTMTAGDLLCEYSMTWCSNALSEPPVDVPQLEQLETQPEISTVPDDVKVPGYSDAYQSTSNSASAPNRPSPPQPRFGRRPSDPPATGADVDAEEMSPSSPKSAIAGQDGRKQGRTRRYWTPQEEAAFLKALDRFGATQVASTSVDPATGRVSVRLGPGVAEMMAILIGSRSCAQVRSHVQKHFIRLERERTKMLKQKTNMQ